MAGDTKHIIQALVSNFAIGAAKGVAAFITGPDDAPVRERWVDEFAADLRQGEDGAYVNFLADEGADRVRAAYPGSTWDRLVAVKATYDPGNLFRMNQNIPPAG